MNDKIEYSDFKHTLTLTDKNEKPDFEIMTWKPELSQFLLDNGIIAYLPKEGEKLVITIETYESDGQEPWNN